jgi:hypothetical protein
MTLAIEDFVNQALLGIGYKRRIADLYEGSPAARAALDIYRQTRDEALQEIDWPFALREILLAANGQAAPSPFLYEFAYPADCLRIRGMRPGPLTGGTREFDPQPILYRSVNDSRTNARAILADQAAPVLIYTARITDPKDWEPPFGKRLIDKLAAKLGFKLMPEANLIQARLALAEQPPAATDLLPPMAVKELPAARG